MTKNSPSKSEQLQRLRRKHSDSGNGRKSNRSFAERRKSSVKNDTVIFSNAKISKTIYRESFRNLYSFFFLIMSLLLIWVAYRALVRMPVWFDEGIAKAIVFGLPVAWLAIRSKYVSQNLGLDTKNIWKGLNFGTAVGGLYGFAAILSQVLSGRMVTSGQFFLTDTFLWMGAMALLTAWWESLFFFALPVQYMRSVASWISDWWIGVFVTIVFLLFHAPLRLILSGGGPDFVLQMAILSLFVVGQFIVYTRTRNLYALVMSHFFWGLVIEVYSNTII